MLTKLPLPAVIGIFLLTAITAVASTTATTTKTPATTRAPTTATLNSVNAATTSLAKIAAEVTRKGNASGNGSGSVSRRRTNVKDVPLAKPATKKTATQDIAKLVDERHADTTTSLLPLQPPLNVTSTTTSTFLKPPIGNAAGKHQLPISATTSQSQSQLSRVVPSSTQKSSMQPRPAKYSSQIRALRTSNVNAEKANVVRNDSNILKQHDNTKKVLPNITHLLPAPVVEINTEAKPKKIDETIESTGYIHFDVDEGNGESGKTATPTRSTRMETVNEVLSNLFPNGFTDIFRFSYASEQPTPANIATSEVSEPAKKSVTVSSAVTKLTAVPSSTTTTTTTEKPRDVRANKFFSYETSVSKEYRRELRPGHTEIVVEKLELLPRGMSTSSGEFSDGSNLITKDDLLRINRAAVDSPVLPSLLMEPRQENATATAEEPKKSKAPIIILNDDDSADMEGISAEDNLIAESQNVGQQVYQRLPVSDKPYGYKVGVQRENGRPESEVNIRIVHEAAYDAAASISQRPIFVPEEQPQEQQAPAGKTEEPVGAADAVPPSQQLDTFQEHAEQSFRHLNLLQEAPSRKFLRNFNPVLSTGAGTSTPKGSFHYEAHALQPTYYIQATELQAAAGKEQAPDREAASQKVQNEPASIGVEEAKSLRAPLQQYDKDATQLRYFREQQFLQQQQQILQQQQQLLLQQQQQEQQQQQHERLIQQQQELQRQGKQKQQLQQQQLESTRQQQLFRPAQQQQQQQPQLEYHQQQQHPQQFHKELQQQQQLPLPQQYALYQQHPPPKEYKQDQEKQQQAQYVAQQEQQQKKVEAEARKRQQQETDKQLQAQQQQQRIKQQKQIEQRPPHTEQKPPNNQPKPLEPLSTLHTHIASDSEPASASLNQHAYQYPLQTAPATPTPHSVVFVTLNSPTTQAARAPHTSRPAFTPKSPYEYVSGAIGAELTTPAAIVKRPQGGYTFVEVQKSVNIHNKLITEKDGKLVEEHETIYPLPQYAVHQQQQVVKSQPIALTAPSAQPSPPAPQQPPPSAPPQAPAQTPKPAAAQVTPHVEMTHTHYPLHYTHQLAVLEEGVHPNDYYFVPKEYASLSANPINVQHIDEPEQQEEASTYTQLEQVLPQHENPQQYVEYIEQYAEQLAEQPAAKHASVQHQTAEQATYSSAQPNEQFVQQQPSEAKETEGKVAEHQVEKIVERPVHIPYPVHVQQYIDRPYPVQEIVETHIPVPYPVPEPVPVPVHVDRYIDRPYPVEKIVEKRVPYAVEKVVEKIVEKEIPIEVEKIVEKVIDRPVPIPIRIPVAIPIPYTHQPLREYEDHAEIFNAPYHTHPNALGWPESSGLSEFGDARSPVNAQIPPKVLQNYYTRMLKKLLPKVLPQRGTSSSSATTATTSTAYTHTQARPKPSTSSTITSFKSPKQQKLATPSSVSGSSKQHSFKIGDMRFDLKPPPPPPIGAEWTQGSRYLYNTLPHDLSVADTSDAEQSAEAYTGPFTSHNEPYDEFQRWRNGHNLKRSPQFGRNLQMEYGFKPPLVPSVEINDQGIPLNAEAKEAV